MSAQVGSAHIAIFPVMKGFKSSVSREMKSAGSASTAEFTNSMKGAGRAAGARVGRDLKAAVSASSSGMGASSVKAMNREVSAASASLSKARLKQQDEAGRVRVAEARLAEAVAKSGAASSQAIAAEERLASARRAHKSATDTVTAATTRLKGAQNAVAKSTSVEATASSWRRLGDSAKSGLGSLVAGAREAGARAGEALGAAVRNAATVAVAGLGTVLAVVGVQAVSTIKAAVADYATWEQAIGGVETLFKGSSDTVAKYAANAYKSSGVSANSYMSQVTSFSASLISSLGGDTEAAAELANRAVIDMSDNANKMGTDLASIQQTYQSIARGNYAMLDNLKLGYGGTKTEMQRLLSDASKLSGKSFSLGSFADVISAIHVVQAELGITGTTAIEAATTIEGSTAMMKASWENWRAELGKTDGDVTAVTDELATSIGVAMGNLLPRILQVVKSLVASIPTLFSGLVETLPRPFQDAVIKISRVVYEVKDLLAPLGAAFLAFGSGGLASVISGSRILGPLLGGLTGPLSMLGGPLGIAAAAFAAFALSGADAEGLVDGVTSVVDKIVAALPGFVAKIAEFVPGLVESILAQVPALLEAGVAIVNTLINGLVTALPILIDGGLALLTGVVQAIVDNLPMIIEGAIQLVTALVQGIVTAIPLLIEGVMTLCYGLVNALLQNMPLIISGGVRLLTGLLTGLLSASPMLLEGVLSLLTALVSNIIENLPLLIEAGIQLLMSLVAGLIQMLPLLIETGIQLLLSLVTGLIDALPQLITAAIELVLQLVAGLLQMLPQLIEAGIQLVVSLIVGLVQAIPQIIEMLPQIVSAIWDGLANVDWLDLGMSIIQGIIDGIISMADSVGNAIGDIVGGILDFFPHSPAKKGPLGPTGWRALKTSGRAMMTQFNDGAAAEAPGIADAMTATANAASLRAQNVLRAASAELNVSATSGDTGKKEVVVQQHNEFSHMDPEVAVELSKQRLAFMVGNAG